jgi:hypothetical protein
MGADLIWHDGVQWCTTGEWGRLAGLSVTSDRPTQTS